MSFIGILRLINPEWILYRQVQLQKDKMSSKLIERPPSHQFITVTVITKPLVH